MIDYRWVLINLASVVATVVALGAAGQITAGLAVA